MTQQEAIELIQPAIDMSIGRQTWLDLGCGSGTFTFRPFEGSNNTIKLTFFQFYKGLF